MKDGQLSKILENIKSSIADFDSCKCPAVKYDNDDDDDVNDDVNDGDPAQVDQCYGLLCELGINGLINRMSRMINNY